MKIKVICGVIIIKNNKFVIIQEAVGKVKNKWNIPGGHLIPGEKITNGAIREAREETGLKVKLKNLIGIYQFKGVSGNAVIGFYFSATTDDQKFNYDKKEIKDAKWIKVEDFLKMNNNLIRGKHLKQIVEDYQNKSKMSLKKINFQNIK